MSICSIFSGKMRVLFIQVCMYTYSWILRSKSYLVVTNKWKNLIFESWMVRQFTIEAQVTQFSIKHLFAAYWICKVIFPLICEKMNSFHFLQWIFKSTASLRLWNMPILLIFTVFSSDSIVSCFHHIISRINLNCPVLCINIFPSESESSERLHENVSLCR